MSHIWECLTPSVAIELVNSLIEGQPFQKHLIEWKKKYLNVETGKVGRSYWRSFLKRNNHRLVSNHGQKCELNRQNWTTYANFWDVYNHICNEMVDTGFTEPLVKSILFIFKNSGEGNFFPGAPQQIKSPDNIPKHINQDIIRK